MTEVYRFRKTAYVLAPYHELEKQTLYFASPETLNDPMEGLRNMVWSGDRIVWTNLFKHYVHCLLWIHLQRPNRRESLTAVDYFFDPDLGNSRLNPEWHELSNASWSTIRDELKLRNFVDTIAAMQRPVRRDELAIYFYAIHFRVLAAIQKVVERGTAPVTEDRQHAGVPGESMLTDSTFLNRMQQLEAEREDIAAVVFSEMYHDLDGQRLTSRLQGNGQRREHEFADNFVDQLGMLLWRAWYVACFAQSYHNSAAWAHYGDGHKGVCLIFAADATDNAHGLKLKRSTGWSYMPFHDVRYDADVDPPDAISFFANIGRLSEPTLRKLWYTDEAGRVSPDMDRVSRKDPFGPDFMRDITRKSKVWAYEKECRLLLLPEKDDPLLNERDRACTYDFSSLKGIIFGIRTSVEDKLKIMDVIKKKCQEHGRTDFKFFQARYSPGHEGIRKHEIPLPWDI